MKISVIGNTINTKKIFQITPIVGDGCWVESNSWSSNKILTHSGYMFTIEFFDDKKLKIYLRVDDVFEDHMWWMRSTFSDTSTKITKEEYEQKLKIIYDELNAFRNTIITFWNKDKSAIPELNFNIKKK